MAWKNSESKKNEKLKIGYENADKLPDYKDLEIIDAIKNVENSPTISIRVRDSATWHRGIRNGVEIDVIKIGDDVIAGSPTGKLNAPKPSGFEDRS